MYRLDNNIFPPHFLDIGLAKQAHDTPVAYISQPPLDVFQNQRAYSFGTLEYSHGSYHADYFPVVPPARLAHEASLFAMAKQGRVIDQAMIIIRVLFTISGAWDRIWNTLRNPFMIPQWSQKHW